MVVDGGSVGNTMGPLGPGPEDSISEWGVVPWELVTAHPVPTAILGRCHTIILQCRKLAPWVRIWKGKFLSESVGPAATRKGTELPDYRIRKVEADRYQAIVYPCALGGNQMLPVTFDESRRDVSFPVRPRWSLAVDDLFGRFAPWAKQIYETPEDLWRPFGRASAVGSP